jgi:uncharacterized protein (DUF486 family)
VIGTPTDDELRQVARKTAEEKAGFYTHLGIYIVVNIFFFILWFVTSGPGTFPWFLIILFGWGIGLVGHYIGTFRGKAYIERMAEKEYQRMKKEQEDR